MSSVVPQAVSFTKDSELTADDLRGAGGGGRAGVIATPHGQIHTPAFIPVGTNATVKLVTPEQVKSTGAEAVLANAYHLYLRPGSPIVDAAGGLGEFMRWPGPTYTDSGGFQVMSLGAGFKKIIDMTGGAADDAAMAPNKQRLAVVDDDGVTFRSHLNGSKHRFTPELSMQIQHELGADIMFAFDELTTLMNTRSYQEHSVERTRLWAQRCLVAHHDLAMARQHRPPQSLWGVIQGAQYEDLRRSATRGLVALSEAALAEGRVGFEGWGIGGALEKHNLGTIVRWCVSELPDHQPRHLLGISEPDDIFVAVENGADTFDCVAPTRMARHGTVLTRYGRLRMMKAEHRHAHSPLDPTSDLPAAQEFTRAYIHHLFRAKEPLGPAICSLVNIRFVVKLMADIRAHIMTGTYLEFKTDFLGRYYAEAGGMG